MHMGSLVASLTVHVLLMKLNLAFADYAILFHVGIRCIETLVVMHLVDH